MHPDGDARRLGGFAVSFTLPFPRDMVYRELLQARPLGTPEDALCTLQMKQAGDGEQVRVTWCVASRMCLELRQ